MELEALQPERSFTPKLNQHPLKKEKIIPLTPKLDPKEAQKWWDIPKKRVKVFPASRFGANKPSPPVLDVTKAEDKNEKLGKLSLFHDIVEEDDSNEIYLSPHGLTGKHKEKDILLCGEEDGKDPGVRRKTTSKHVKDKVETRISFSVIIPGTGKISSDNMERRINLEAEERTLSPKASESPKQKFQLNPDPQHKDQTEIQGKQSETQKSKLGDVQIEDF